MTHAQPPLHVVLGAGQIGSLVTERLLQRGHRVRIVRRSAQAGAAHPRLEHLHGDITDLAFAASAARGATVVYDCMNPPYHLWPAQLLPIARGALHGAARAGARLVALDCLYMYGCPDGPLREDAPLRPCSRKGALRVKLQHLRADAHRRGEVAVTIGRASDFVGPALQFSFWNERFFRRIFAGRPGESMGDPDLPHSYTYAADVARALVTLGEAPAAGGPDCGIWHLPTPLAESSRALARRFGAALGLPGADVRRVPRLLLRAAGLFSPMLREVAEMTYQWEVPFVLDDTRFRTAFGYGATPIEEIVAATAAWARRFAPAPS